MKVTGKRESLDELKDEKPDLGPKESDDNAKDEDKEEKTEEDEETKKLPKYSPGVPVGECSIFHLYITRSSCDRSL